MADNPADREVLVVETAQIVKSYVAHNHVPRDDVAGLIEAVFAALVTLDASPSAVAGPAAQEPAVPIRKSVTADYLICLEDGRSFKSLKRHLAAHYDLTPAEYRAKWGLPPDYPMIAANYAAQRSQLARDMGLGRKPKMDRDTDAG
ncbi:Predicted transcriptional regulator [Aureimonas jatrophae]|uniref:Predicted transcriptional regulator n=2 Tax=Aureimonas jatrophae TaxID=1166073 RepID=A0A1H0KC74_9HYPH|nr:Predicted transcriptional regulator [Aureimonas jatrophae]